MDMEKGIRFHYFDLTEADSKDFLLRMCVEQGYVPSTCLLAGIVVWDEMKKGEDPCGGCNCDRAKCHGRARLS